MIEFRARAVAFLQDEELGVNTLVMAEQPDGSGLRLEVHRSLAVTDQDRALGMDDYCLVTEAGTYYGGVTAWSLGGNQAQIVLNADAVTAMGAPGGFRILVPDSAGLEAVSRGLRTMVGPPAP